MSPDMKNYSAADVDRIGADCFIRGFAAGILVISVLLACFDWMAK